MDTAVGLVQAYLRVNGYFTVAEYPVLDATGPGGPRTITDLDILAVRLHRAPGASGTVDAPLDPALGAGGGADMIVGEVKEGGPHPNPAMRDPAVLEAAFTRFGCCAPTDAARLVAELLETGRTVAGAVLPVPRGGDARGCAGGSSPGGVPARGGGHPGSASAHLPHRAARLAGRPAGAARCPGHRHLRQSPPGGMPRRVRDAATAAGRYRAAQSRQGRHVVAARSGHYIPATESDLIAAEIRRLVLPPVG